MQFPFPTLDELRCTDKTVRAEQSTSVSTHARFTELADALSKQTAFSKPPSAHREGTPPFPEYRPAPNTEDAPDLDALRAEAEAIRLQAIQDAERIREQAYREGYQRGYEQGYTDGEQHAQQQADEALQRIVEALRAQVEQVVQSVQTQYHEYLQHAETQMLELASEVARKIVREELKLQPEHALAIVRDALRRVQGFTHIRIRVNPLDLELVRQNRAALLHIVDGVEGIEIVEDRRVDPGGCIIETEQGVYDARIKTQLSELERVMREAA